MLMEECFWGQACIWMYDNQVVLGTEEQEKNRRIGNIEQT